MSTFKTNITARRIAELARTKETLFHIKDLANLWKIQDPNSLRVTLKRYVQNGLLHRIYRGFYSLAPLDQISPVLLGARSLHTYCILSTETVLFENGFRSQAPTEITFLSEVSLHWRIGVHQFRSRQLAPQYLYNPIGIILEDGVQKADPKRAIADMLYFNPWAAFDKNVDWKKIQALQSQIGYPLTPHRYGAPKT